MKHTTMLLALAFVLGACQKEETVTPTPPVDPGPPYYPTEVASYTLPGQEVEVYKNSTLTTLVGTGNYRFTNPVFAAGDTLTVRTRLSAPDTLAGDSACVRVQLFRITQRTTDTTICVPDTAWVSVRYVAGELGWE